MGHIHYYSDLLHPLVSRFEQLEPDSQKNRLVLYDMYVSLLKYPDPTFIVLFSLLCLLHVITESKWQLAGQWKTFALPPGHIHGDRKDVCVKAGVARECPHAWMSLRSLLEIRGLVHTTESTKHLIRNKWSISSNGQVMLTISSSGTVSSWLTRVRRQASSVWGREGAWGTGLKYFRVRSRRGSIDESEAAAFDRRFADRMESEGPPRRKSDTVNEDLGNTAIQKVEVQVSISKGANSPIRFWI